MSILIAGPLRVFLMGLFAAVLTCIPASGIAASYTFVDGARFINGSLDTHLNDSSNTGNPVHVYIPGTSLGPGYRLESAAAVSDGLAGDGTYVPPVTLKSYSSIGDITTTDQVQLRSQARFDTGFEITAPGIQSISITWDGELFATGDAMAWYNLKVGFNPWNGIYDQLNLSGDAQASTVPVAGSRTFLFDFDAVDVGSVYNLQVFLTTYVDMPYGGGATSGAYADFYDTFKVTGWSSGLASLDGVSPVVPVPAAVWLFVSGLLGLITVTKIGK
jgi:hypothetical protein